MHIVGISVHGRCSKTTWQDMARSERMAVNKSQGTKRHAIIWYSVNPFGQVDLTHEPLTCSFIFNQDAREDVFVYVCLFIAQICMKLCFFPAFPFPCWCMYDDVCTFYITICSCPDTSARQYELRHRHPASPLRSCCR